MDFIDLVKQHSQRVKSLKDNIATEEATKTSLIMPFFAMLGYDVFNPEELTPEYVADVGIKKGEKVDYAILKDGKPAILIECKWIGEPLASHDSQLYRYFGVSKAKFAILTNGQIYKFFTDLDEPNKMDEKPFLEINMLDIRENLVPELKKFQKNIFDFDEIFNTASQLKYANEFKRVMAKELQNPSDNFVKMFLSGIYTGAKTQNVIDKFRPILKKSLNDYINEIMNDKIKTALASEGSNTPEDKNEDVDDSNSQIVQTPEKVSKIVTTQEEIEAYVMIKGLCKELVSPDDITYKDTESYFNVLYKGNVRKWICRLKLTDTQKVLITPDENKKEQKISLENGINDLEKYKELLLSILNRYIS